jgi:hypothetical protein
MPQAPLASPAALALLAAGLLGGTAAAEETGPATFEATRQISEPAACREPFGATGDIPRPDPAALRRIARDCTDAVVRRLYYNRAYHTELLADLRTLARLKKGYDAGDRTRLEQGRIYIGLTESFAARAWPRRPGVIIALNRAYEQSIRTVELTIGGYDRLAARPPAPR